MIINRPKKIFLKVNKLLVKTSNHWGRFIKEKRAIKKHNFLLLIMIELKIRKMLFLTIKNTDGIQVKINKVMQVIQWNNQNAKGFFSSIF